MATEFHYPTIAQELELLIAEHPHPKRWNVTLEVNPRLKTTLGKCKVKWPSPKSDRQTVLELNPRLTTEQAMNTIRHEYAHFLAGPGEGHGKKWKELAVQVGAKPVRCGEWSDAQRAAISKYAYQCQECGEVYRRVRRIPTGSYCGVCSGDLVLMTS